ncbi:MAG: 23S rRNA (guanosine(2251)-2'-O)-methyltransferase RlmB [Syntrophales bacterium]|nr:23S rRNA (guanosine(2251)-2'-O)-methyltransferase RlmB [Syntrophales bacterium]
MLALAVAKGVPVEFRERAYLDRLAAGGSHQGVAALVKNIPGLTLEEMIDRRHPELSGDLVLIADGVMDPRNLGALIRTAHCFGVNGVVVPRHRAAGITAAVVKASAGAAYLTPVVTVENLARTVDFLKEQGFWTYGAAAEAAVFLDNLTFEGRVAIVVGGEGGGIRSLVRKKLDFLFAIPMIGNINSLNVSVAAGIVLHTAYQAMRKRG